MCSKKCVGPRMGPGETPALTGILVNTFHPEPFEAVYYREKKK